MSTPLTLREALERIANAPPPTVQQQARFCAMVQRIAWEALDNEAAATATSTLASSPPAETWTEEQIQRAYSAYRKHDGDCLSSLRAAIATLSVAPPAETEEGVREAMGALQAADAFWDAKSEPVELDEMTVIRKVKRALAACAQSQSLAAMVAESAQRPVPDETLCAAPLFIAALSRGETDPPCTDCGGSGVSYQTERRCSCRPEAAAPSREAIARTVCCLGGCQRPHECRSVEWADEAYAILSLFSPQSEPDTTP